MSRRYLMIATLTIVLFGSCADDDYAPLAGIMADNVSIIEDEKAKDVVVEPDRLIFPLSGNEAVLGLQSGDILVSGWELGFLRKVRSIEQTGDSILVLTDQASITEAIQQGRFSTGNAIVTGEIESSIRTMSQPLKFCPIFEQDISGTTLYQQGGVAIAVSQGNLTLSPCIEMDGEIRDWEVKNFIVAASGEASAAFALQVTTGAEYNYSYQPPPLWESKTKIIKMVIPGLLFPVIAAVKLSLSAGFEVDFKAGAVVESGAQATGFLSFGAKYDGEEWSRISEEHLEFNAIGPTFDLNLPELSLRVYLEPRIDVKFYGVAGPFLSVQPYARYRIIPLPTVSCELTAGLKGLAGGEVKILGHKLADFQLDLFDFSTNIPSICEECGAGESICGDECCPDGSCCDSVQCCSGALCCPGGACCETGFPYTCDAIPDCHATESGALGAGCTSGDVLFCE